MNLKLPDTQNYQDFKGKPIHQAGIKSLKYPVCIADGEKNQPSIAQWLLSVALSSSQRGTHMSRFIEVLHQKRNDTFGIKEVSDWIDLIKNRFETNVCNLECEFDFFIEKRSPISHHLSLMDYKVKVLAQSFENDDMKRSLKVRVPVKSLCPCSKSISQYGAHNQRSHITITLEKSGGDWPNKVDTHTMIELAESSASSEIWALLKREDEKYITERAYDNPQFVEDTIRTIGAKLDSLEGLDSYRVEVENFESIHNHSAFASLTG